MKVSKKPAFSSISDLFSSSTIKYSWGTKKLFDFSYNETLRESSNSSFTKTCFPDASLKNFKSSSSSKSSPFSFSSKLFLFAKNNQAFSIIVLFILFYLTDIKVFSNLILINHFLNNLFQELIAFESSLVVTDLLTSSQLHFFIIFFKCLFFILFYY